MQLGAWTTDLLDRSQGAYCPWAGANTDDPRPLHAFLCRCGTYPKGAAAPTFSRSIEANVRVLPGQTTAAVAARMPSTIDVNHVVYRSANRVVYRSANRVVYTDDRRHGSSLVDDRAFWNNAELH